MTEQKLVTLKINDRDVQVPAGTTVIEATRLIGTEVPSFCYYPGLSLQGACRMCLVEVEKMPKMQTACTQVVAEGMVVRTNTEQVRQARKYMLEFLLTNHPLDCPVCDKGGECELQDMVFSYGADTSRFVEEKIHRPEEKWSELVYYDAPRCILCFRCVRVCDEGMDVKALGVGMRGANSVIIPNREDHLECEECGMCIDICPVGALTSGTYRYKTRPWEMQYVSTICTHCSNGCKTTLSVRNHEILRANNRDLSGINGDFLCVKGRFGFDFTKHPERFKQPMVRKGDKLYPVSWEEAMQTAATKLKQIVDANGPDSVGFIGSNHTSNEENYLFQRLARATFGTNNVDHHRTIDYSGLVHRARRSRRRILADDEAALRCAGGVADRQRSDGSESTGRVAGSHRHSPAQSAPLCFERARHQAESQGDAVRADSRRPRSGGDSLDGQRAGPARAGARREIDAAQSGARRRARSRDRFRRGSFRRGNRGTDHIRIAARRAKFATWRSATTRIRAARPTWACCPTGCRATHTSTTRRPAMHLQNFGAA